MVTSASKLAVLTQMPLKFCGNVHLACTNSARTGNKRKRSGPSCGDFNVLHSAVIDTDRN